MADMRVETLKSGHVIVNGKVLKGGGHGLDLFENIISSLPKRDRKSPVRIGGSMTGI